MALGFRLYYQLNLISACSLGSPGFEELRWLKPVRPGDTLYTEAEVLEKRPSRSKPDRGTVKVAFCVKNQSDEVVMTFLALHILLRRPAEG